MIGIQSSQQNNLFSQPSGYPAISLLHFDGADGSTTITDEYGLSWSVFGNAQLDTTFKEFGTSSLLLDGAGDFIQSGLVTDFNFGTSDFTIELRWKRVVGSKTYSAFFSSKNSAFTSGAVAFFVNDTEMWIGVAGGGDPIPVTAHGINDSNFHHIAATREGNTFRLFVDGALIVSNSSSTSINFNGSNGTRIGKNGWDTDANSSLNGSIDEMRITKGKARYTSSFSPPTAPFTE